MKDLTIMKTSRYIILLATVLATASCSSFLEEKSNDESYIHSYKDLSELLLGEAYVPANQVGEYNSSSNSCMFIHLLADELQECNVASSSALNKSEAHNYTFGAFTWQPRMDALANGGYAASENREWKEFYKHINAANNIITESYDVPQTSDAEISGARQVRAEALFCRAYLYFWLTNVYGKPYDPATASTDPAVPLKTSSIVEESFSRNTVQECYNQIVSDLLEAEQNMALATTSSSSIYHADINAVRLLLSRVYLYMQNWTKCAEYAQKVVDAHPTLENLRTTDNKFSSTSNPENIFTMGGDDLICMLGRYYQGLSVDAGLYHAYSDNDYRKSQWYWNYGDFTGLILRSTGSSSTVVAQDDSEWYNTYYTSTAATRSSYISSVFWLRAAEAYVNLAEAEAYLGNTQSAQSALASLTAMRYIPGTAEASVSETGSDLISRIRKERRLEFALEGQRWFDLRRYRVCQVQPEKVSLRHVYSIYDISDPTKVQSTRDYTLTEDDASWTCPIPHEVLATYPDMKGNGNAARDYAVEELEP